MSIVADFTDGYYGYVAVDDFKLNGCTSHPTTPPNIVIPPRPIVGNFRFAES